MKIIIIIIIIIIITTTTTTTIIIIIIIIIIILQAVCTDVEMEPVLQEVTGEVLPRGTNKAPDA